MIIINVPAQTLSYIGAAGGIRDYAVCTARRGVGQTRGSEQTPAGRHLIRAKIGAGRDKLTVYASRRPTGECYTPALAQAAPGRDWILGRILWLSGLERGRNRLGSVDTMARYIYIHGQPPELPLGEPSSHGCIRMHPDDLVELFDCVQVGERVSIVA